MGQRRFAFGLSRRVVVLRRVFSAKVLGRSHTPNYILYKLNFKKKKKKKKKRLESLESIEKGVRKERYMLGLIKEIE